MCGAINNSLKMFTAYLQNLKAIGGQLTIKGLQTETLEALSNLETIGLQTDSVILIRIQNTYLEDCSLDIVCDLLQASPDRVFIQGNRSRCYDAGDVWLGCL